MNKIILNESIKSIQSIQSIERIQIMTAMAIITAAVGFKYVLKDFEEECDIYFDSRLMKSLTVFSLIYINTKNTSISLFFTIVYNLLHSIVIKYCRENNKDTE